MSLNVSTVCQQITSPLYNNCMTITHRASSALLPFQIIVIGIPVALLIWKIVYCFTKFASNSHCSSNCNKPLNDPTEESLLELTPKKRRICNLKTIDNGVMTGAIVALSVPPAVALTAARIYLSGNTCRIFVQTGTSLCEYTLNTLLNNL